MEEAHPDSLEDEDLVTRFTALWAADTRRGVRVAGQWLDRELLGAEDVEPLTWALAERAAAITADDYIEGLAAVSRYRRRVQQWWHPTSSTAAWDVLLTPTLAGPARLGEMAQNPDNPLRTRRRAGELAAFAPAFDAAGQPAISLPFTSTTTACPSASSLRRRLPAGGRARAGAGRGCRLEAAPWPTAIPVAGHLNEELPWNHPSGHSC